MENIPTWTCVVALALRDEDGRWLMHRRPDYKHHGGLWEFPGGKVEPGESPALALVREIEEELGLVLDAAHLTPACFAQEPLDAGFKPIVILLYTASKIADEPEAREGGAVGWFTASEIEALARPPLDVALCERLFSAART